MLSESTLPQPLLKTASSLQPAKPPRSLLIDIVRGIAISLVALGHTDQGILHRGWWGHSPAGLYLEGFIYAFHMPAFFFVSGVFLCSSANRRGSWGFTIEKFRTILYPYLVWSCLFAITPFFLGRFMKESVPTWPVFLKGVATGDISWFLPTIFFVVMLGMLLRRVPMPLLFVLSAIVSLYWPGIGVTFVDRGLAHLPFLVAGMWAGRSVEALNDVPKLPAALGFAALFALIGALLLSPEGGSRYLFIPLGLLGTLMLLLLARCLKEWAAAARLLAWAGAGSIGIFLMAAYFQGGGRELLLGALHSTNPYLQLLFPTLLAVLCPAWIYQNRDRLHLGWMFVLPFWADRAAGKPVPPRA